MGNIYSFFRNTFLYIPIKNLLITTILNIAYSSISNAACPPVTVTGQTLIPNIQTNMVNLPPQFTDVIVECETTTNTLCSDKAHAADTVITLDTTTAGAYANLNDYSISRSNRPIFPNFYNTLVLTPTFVSPYWQYFGAAVAISGDGSTLAIGSSSVYPPLTSYVNIYKRQGNDWIFSQQITRPDNWPITRFGEPLISFGSTLALSYDGSTLAIGGIPLDSIILPCYVCMYTKNQISNNYALEQIIPGPMLGGFGQELALSANGKYLVVNDSLSMTINGNQRPDFTINAWVFVKSESCENNCEKISKWVEQQYLTPIFPGNIIQPSSLPSAQPYGQKLAISADGSTIAMGYPPFNQEIGIRGAVFIFNRINTTWQQTQIIMASSIPNTILFGAAVALSGDGKYLAVGDPFAFSGQVFQKVVIFTKQEDGYYILDSIISAPQPNTVSFRFGISVSFSNDGTVLVIGAGNRPATGNNQGGVYIAVRGPGNRWSLPFMRIGAANSNLGYSVACSADGAFVVAGAAGTNSQQGATFVFSPSGSFIPNDTTVTGTLCVQQHTTINAPLNVAGDIHLNNTIVTGTGLVTPCAAVLSDTSMKDNITPLDPVVALEKLRSIQPVTFFWKDAAHNLPSQEVGFAAQQMQEIFPHWVSSARASEHEKTLLNDDKKYMLTIKAELYAYLITALERLVQRNAEQKAAIAELQRYCQT